MYVRKYMFIIAFICPKNIFCEYTIKYMEKNLVYQTVGGAKFRQTEDAFLSVGALRLTAEKMSILVLLN